MAAVAGDPRTDRGCGTERAIAADLRRRARSDQVRGRCMAGVQIDRSINRYCGEQGRALWLASQEGVTCVGNSKRTSGVFALMDHRRLCHHGAATRTHGRAGNTTRCASSRRHAADCASTTATLDLDMRREYVCRELTDFKPVRSQSENSSQHTALNCADRPGFPQSVSLMWRFP